MDNNDLSLIIAISALVLSVLSPILSSIISGLFRVKEMRLQLQSDVEKGYQKFYEQHRAEVIERYINAVGKNVQASFSANRQEFGEAGGEIYLYVDESLWPLLDSITDKISNRQSPKEEYILLCKALASKNVRPKHEQQPEQSDYYTISQIESEP